MVPRNQKWLILLILVLLGGILPFFIIDKPPALPAVMILPTAPLAVTSGRLPDRWMPAKWLWLQRACQFVFGPPKQVGFNVQFMETSETAAAINRFEFLITTDEYDAKGNKIHGSAGLIKGD
jgi:hypothetical protein